MPIWLVMKLLGQNNINLFSTNKITLFEDMDIFFNNFVYVEVAWSFQLLKKEKRRISLIIKFTYIFIKDS